MFNAFASLKCSKNASIMYKSLLNRVQNPNWPEANQLAIYKHGRGFELGTTVNKSSFRSAPDLHFGGPKFKSRPDR